MNPTIEAIEADRIPADATVCHYDELTGHAKHVLPDAAANGTADVPWRAAEQFSGIDVVKFTSYYRVEIVDLPPTTDRSRAEGASTSDSTTPTRSSSRTGRPERPPHSGEPILE